MPSIVSLRRVLTLTVTGVAVLLAACAEPPYSPSPAPPPAVSLSMEVIHRASAYRRYMATASAISPAFRDGQSVADGLRTAAAYEPRQLLGGAIAYGAIAALQDPRFVAGVRAYANNPGRRRAVAYAIMKDPAYVAGIPGAAGAAGLVMGALGEDGRKLLVQGRAMKQAAYDVQHAAWSKEDVSAREARLARAKQLSKTPLRGEVAETRRLQRAVSAVGALTLTAEPAAPPYAPVVIRAMAVAALATLGYAGDASLEQVTPILDEPASASCLRMSKLNLYQSLSAAEPHYEDVFCMGQHSLIDTGRWVTKSVGVAEPAKPAPTRLSAAPKPAAPPANR